jgi:hypothetical protein
MISENFSATIAGTKKVALTAYLLKSLRRFTTPSVTILGLGFDGIGGSISTVMTKYKFESDKFIASF